MIAAYLDEFASSLAAKGRSEATIRSYVSDVSNFINWADPASDGSDFDKAALAYINERRADRRAPTTVIRNISAIKVFHEFLVRKGVDADPPFVDYRPPKAVKALAHPLPEGMTDVKAMINHAFRPNHRVLIALCGLAGLRVGEARSITPRSFIERPDGWWLAVFGKGGSYREVPCSDDLVQIIQSMPPTPPDTPYVDIGDRAARKAVSNVAKRAGVSRDVSSHDLRHTFGSFVYGKTKDLRLTQKLLGHSSAATTETYTHVEQDAMREAVGS